MQVAKDFMPTPDRFPFLSSAPDLKFQTIWLRNMESRKIHTHVARHYIVHIDSDPEADSLTQPVASRI